MRFYFVKDARIVADRTFPGLSPDEAVETAGKMLKESALSYDGIEVWSHTRRISRLGRIARKPPIGLRLVVSHESGRSGTSRALCEFPHSLRGSLRVNSVNGGRC